MSMCSSYGSWLSFLISFGVVNRTQPAVQRINFALFRLTDPVLRPIRKHMPDLGGIDISPIVIILVLEFIQPRADLHVPAPLKAPDKT